jgi:AcrR family transcriptional regulator
MYELRRNEFKMSQANVRNKVMKATSPRRDPDKTREAILQAAYEEIYINGFQAASLEGILARAGVTKGALYHHFANKLELGYAVVEDVIGPIFARTWIEPLSRAEDPIDTLQSIISSIAGSMSEDFTRNGCPLNNLCQEMSPLNDEFRRRLSLEVRNWREAIAEAIERGKANGQVAEFVRPVNVAAFVVATMGGFAGLVKNSQSREVTQLAGPELFYYLDSLRSAQLR